MWKYQINDNTWTWVSGSDTVNQQPVYGQKGAPSINNVPGPRANAVGCFDSIAQEFWLFGGYGYLPNSNSGLS